MWFLKAFSVGALVMLALILISIGYTRLEEFLTKKYGSDAMKLLWAFVVASLILGTLILKAMEVYC